MNPRWTILASVILLAALLAFGLFRSGVVSFLSAPENVPDNEIDPRILTSLPYTSTVSEPEARKATVGVTVFDEARAYPGINLYSNHYETTAGAFLMDMGGDVVHHWQVPDSSMWKFVTLDQHGNAYAMLAHAAPGREPNRPVSVNLRLIKMDWQSQVQFELRGDYHHDLQFMDDGTIVTLNAKEEIVTYNQQDIAVINDYLTFITPAGHVLKEVPLSDVLGEERALQMVLSGLSSQGSNSDSYDLFHTNTVSILDHDIDGVGKTGDILLCVRNLNLVFVYDPEAGEIVWRFHGWAMWQHPHEPRFLANGALLIFDNGHRRQWSRIIELDPVTKQIQWEYQGDPPHSFFTVARGSVQRLPNGNTLITESDTGRVFEITRNGEVVWDWYNPSFVGGRRSVVYRMKRLDSDVVDAWTAAQTLE